jgi:hypothetical protein
MLDTIPELTPILNWPGYFLSRDGRLWSTRKPGGNEAFYDVPRLQKPQRRGKYLKVTLGVRGVRRQVPLHILMLEVYRGPCPEGMEGCHNNGIRADCSIDNLRWGTRKSNMQDKITHGTIAQGERNGVAVMTNDVARAIKIRFANGETATTIARDIGLNRRTVAAVIGGQNWKWLTP